jgi:hyperosmotically inducible protein
MNDRLRLTSLVLAFVALAVMALPSLAALPPQETEKLEEEELLTVDEILQESEALEETETLEEAEALEEAEIPQTTEAVPIIVGPPESVAEAQLQMAVRLALLEHLKDDAFPIKITVDVDSVILTGAVLYRSTQELATEVVKSVDGVRRVRNMIRISPDAPGEDDNLAKKAGANTGNEVSDAGMETWVKTRLFDSIGRQAFRVEVEVTEGVVSLRGSVKSSSYKLIAVETAEKVKGIWKVIDLITVEEEE